jgi:hypothetical protein
LRKEESSVGIFSSSRKLLTRDEILNQQGLPRELVEVPEWGGEVLVQGLTGKQRDEFELSLSNIAEKGADPKKLQYRLDNTRAKLVAISCIDEGGALLFTQADVTALGGKSAAALDRLFSVAQRLSGISQEDVAKLKEGLGKDPSGDSGSNSPSPSESQ